MEECLESDIWTDSMFHVLGSSHIVGYPKSVLRVALLSIAHCFLFSRAEVFG